MGKIAVIQLASRIHGEGYVRDMAETFKEYAGTFDGVTIVPEVATGIDDVEFIAKKFRGYYPMLVFLTGGTSRLARTLLHFMEVDSAVFIAHGEHNSLPSAISARARLELEGVFPWIFACHDPKDSECRRILSEALKTAVAVSSIKNSKVCLVGLDEVPNEVECFRRSFNAEVSIISTSEFESLIMSQRDSTYVKEFLEIVRDVPGASGEQLKEIGAIYAALKKLFMRGDYSAIAVNCFPYLIKHKVTPCLALAVLNSNGYIAGCEADLNALFLMMLSKYLTGLSGWIANPSSISEGKLYLAHCTAALELLTNPRAISHFESGYPYGLTGELKYREVTLASVDYEFTAIAAAKSVVLKSGQLSDLMCRTQAVLRLDFPAEVFPQIALANHHVVMSGDLRRYLRAVSHLLGLAYIEYSRLAEEAGSE
ncbi:MAG: hypothetical protein J7J11_03440 [Desulfurococcales archaeon]|nr:hypothetical protein [Desulfurococcales archaeon]